MKKLSLVAICSIMFIACGNKQKSDENIKYFEQKKYETTASKEGKCIGLTTEDFNKRVADTSKKRWRYLGDKPAIIDFYADWCGPCRMIAPTLEEIAKKYNGELYIYKVNIDNEPELSQRFGISAIPTIMFVPINGEPITERGIIGMEGFEKYIKKVLLKHKPQ